MQETPERRLNKSPGPLPIWMNAVRSKKGPATFQRAMDIQLLWVKRQSVLLCLDKIVVNSKIVQEHLTNVQWMLSLLHNNEVALKLKNCSLFKKNFNYLGHIIQPGRVENAEATKKAIWELQDRRTQTEVRSFLCSCNVFEGFVARSL